MVSDSDSVLKPMSRAGHRSYRSLRVALKGYFKAVHRLEVVGEQNVPSTGGFILALGAHRSIVDTPLAAMATKRTLRYMGAEAYFEIPVFGKFLDLVGGFPVERDLTDRQALRMCEEVLALGEPLVLFPESTRGSGPKVGELKEGTAFIAARAGVPIVPVGIGGAERCMGIGSKGPKPTKLALVVGEPIQPPQPEDGKRVKRSQIKGLSEELGRRLQTLFDEARQIAG